VHLRFAIHVAEQATSLRPSDLRLRVHPHATHERHVEHQSAVRRGQTRDVVAPALDAQHKPVLAKSTQAISSAVPRQRTTRAGLRSISPPSVVFTFMSWTSLLRHGASVRTFVPIQLYTRPRQRSVRDPLPTINVSIEGAKAATSKPKSMAGGASSRSRSVMTR
jgi:hypothetical protein